jgi:hypothetical protein
MAGGWHDGEELNETGLLRSQVFIHPSPIIAFDMSHCRTLLLDSFVLTTMNRDQTRYKLRGVIYHSPDHFTSRFITESGSVWYHDGLTGQRMQYEGNVNLTDLETCQSGVANCAFYVISSQAEAFVHRS